MRKKKKPNLMKIIAVFAIFLFAAVVIVGAVKSYHFKKKFQPLAAEQIAAVESVVREDMMNEGIKQEDYDIKVRSSFRKFRDKSSVKNVAFAYAKAENSSYSFMIDMGDMKIVHQTKSSFRGWMKDQNKKFFKRNGIK